jgi:AcrR family transcriptional regulator
MSLLIVKDVETPLSSRALRPDRVEPRDMRRGVKLTTARKVDGRRLRSARTEELLIKVYLELADKMSPVAPDAKAVARRAGLSLRSIFVRFPNLRALQLAAIDYNMAKVVASRPIRLKGGDRATRLRNQTSARARLCERWSRLWRALVFNQGNDPEFKKRIELSRQGARAFIQHMYAPELAQLSAGDAARTIKAIEALTEVDAWSRMREVDGLSIEEARLVWAYAIDRLLPPSP